MGDDSASVTLPRATHSLFQEGCQVGMGGGGPRLGAGGGGGVCVCGGGAHYPLREKTAFARLGQ